MVLPLSEAASWGRGTTVAAESMVANNTVGIPTGEIQNPDTPRPGLRFARRRRDIFSERQTNHENNHEPEIFADGHPAENSRPGRFLRGRKCNDQQDTKLRYHVQRSVTGKVVPWLD